MPRGTASWIARSSPAMTVGKVTSKRSTRVEPHGLRPVILRCERARHASHCKSAVADLHTSKSDVGQARHRWMNGRNASNVSTSALPHASRRDALPCPCCVACILKEPCRARSSQLAPGRKRRGFLLSQTASELQTGQFLAIQLLGAPIQGG